MNKFHVFTVGKNTRNRQLIYFYLPPYFICRSCVSSSRACCLRIGPFKTFSIFLFAILTVFIAIAPYIVLKLSNVSVQKLKLRTKRIFMILIIRYNFEISDNDHPNSLSQMLTLNFAIANARLVTLAPGLRPERRFAPLARGLHHTGLLIYFSYRINFRSDGKIRGCLHYTALFRSELILPLKKQVLTAVIYWNMFKITILS